MPDEKKPLDILAEKENLICTCGDTDCNGMEIAGIASLCTGITERFQTAFVMRIAAISRNEQRTAIWRFFVSFFGAIEKVKISRRLELCGNVGDVPTIFHIMMIRYFSAVSFPK